MRNKILCILLTAIMLLTLIPITAFAAGNEITNKTPEDDSAKNHGYIDVDKANASEGDTVTITVHPDEGYQLKSLTYTPAPTISTIADVLATVEGFPEDSSGGTKPAAPSDAWVNGSDGRAFIYPANNVACLIFMPSNGYKSVYVTTAVTAGENCYTASISNGTLKFNMEDGVLTSIEYTSTNDKKDYDGTYTSSAITPAEPVTITPEKQSDGTYQFTMPDYNVTVTAEFEEVPVTIADILPANFPDNENDNSWRNSENDNVYIYKTDSNLVFNNSTEDCYSVPLSSFLTKEENPEVSYVYSKEETKIQFNMTGDNNDELENIVVNDCTIPICRGTYYPPEPSHIHAFTYTASNGKITATCTDGCTEGWDTVPLTLTLTAPASLVYDGNAKECAFASGENTAWKGAGLQVPTITYTAKSGSSLTDYKAINAGSYTASITVDTNKTASLDFEITKATPYIKNNPAPTAINLGQKLSDSTLGNGYAQVSSTDSTQVAGWFEWSEPDTMPAIADSEVTPYDVTFTPADETNYNTAFCQVTIPVTPLTCNVTLEKQSGTGGTDSVTATYDAAMPAITIPTREGFIFNGYFDEASGGNQYYDANGASVKDWDKNEPNATLFAQWTQQYTVTYDGNGATSGEVVDNNKYVSGDKFTVLSGDSLVREGYTFKEWNRAADGSDYEYNPGEVQGINGNITLYAQWTKNPTPEPDPEPEPDLDPINYKVIEGANSTWVIADGENPVFRSNADFSKFVRVELDGKVLDPANYTAKSGSTIITLKPEFAAKLATGKHTINIVSTDGAAATVFYIEEVIANTDGFTLSEEIMSSAFVGFGIVGLSAVFFGLKKKKVR